MTEQTWRDALQATTDEEFVLQTATKFSLYEAYTQFILDMQIPAYTGNQKLSETLSWIRRLVVAAYLVGVSEGGGDLENIKQLRAEVRRLENTITGLRNKLGYYGVDKEML